MDQHPVDRVPGTYLERAQQQLYRALMSNPSETGWRLSWRFNAWSVAAARAMASKYDGFIPHVAEVLRTWRDRPITDVLVALQMLAIQGYIDRRSTAKMKDLLHHMASELKDHCWTFSQYRLVHHVFSTQAELFEDHVAAWKAVNVARQFPLLEVRHLRNYGWGFGPQIVKYYDRAIKRETVRASNMVEYNIGMKALAEELLSPEYFCANV